MAGLALSRRDINVLEKIRDPESNPGTGPLIDPGLPKDPNLRDEETYSTVAARERETIRKIQQAETQPTQSDQTARATLIAAYEACVAELARIIADFPRYASARNNRAQAVRRLHGDGLLLWPSPTSGSGLLQAASQEDRAHAAASILSDLDETIALLTPPSPFAAISPHTAKTLSLAYTQRAAIYLTTSKLLDGSSINLPPSRIEASWSAIKFEEAASRDFAFGGRYGNEIAKGLAVSTNPTAKLCGQMVKAAMKKEYGSDFAT